MQIETYRDRAKVMEEEVRRMKGQSHWTYLNLLRTFNALDRYVSCEGVNANRNDSLHATALAFRLLRQHGHEVSQHVFNKFKDEKGNFMESLGKDIKGMLSLYEASHFAFEGEIIMDEAKAFAKLHLKDHIQNTRECQAEQAKHALELPSIRRAQRLDAPWSIEAYSRSEDANQVLLQLAAIDFNMVQSILQGDIRDVSRWWRVGMIFEPQYSYARKELTKLVTFITIVDDVYDVHGTVDELELFTDAVQRWDGT
ncbi:hypothetical protein K2173_018694 [Erythroxylum novogranatense]|uniref:Uncharacterized protein n=1 Tax=Erythroxylum novogranatense TaxID=1862640 RepID=A0AAV8SB56_9ROSI|nr:hypothetical protein K2173_018694 [Erythroxylum novogranatense]